MLGMFSCIPAFLSGTLLQEIRPRIVLPTRASERAFASR